MGIKVFFKWLGYFFGALVALLLVAVTGIYVRSEMIFREQFAPVEPAAFVPLPDAAAERGHHLVRTRGCLGCHNNDGGGRVFVDNFAFGYIPAPNLTRVVHEYSPTEFERAVRQGIRPDGTPLVIMPAEMYWHLSDRDLTDIRAYLMSLPRVENAFEPKSMGPAARGFIALGVFKVAPEYVREHGEPLRYEGDDVIQRGKYLAMTSCAECHGSTLHGNEADESVPDLVVASAYTREKFHALLNTGVAADGRELGLMARVAISRFVHFTPEEKDAIHAYLTSAEFLASE